MLPLEGGTSTPITPRASPATPGDRTEQHNHPIRSKKYKHGKCKTDPDWPERMSKNWKAAVVNWRSASGTPATTH
jgi:hypothetical protein